MGHESNLERLIREELERRGFKEREDFFCKHSLSTGFIADFYFPAKKLIIEADGEKWHTNKKKERFRDHMISRTRIRVVHLQGKDILRDVAKCVDGVLGYG